jgi:hypothetical protein
MSAVLVVMIFGISTVGFGLILANTHAAPTASGPVLKGQTATAEGKSCRVLSQTSARLSGAVIVMGGLEANKKVVGG